MKFIKMIGLAAVAAAALMAFLGAGTASATVLCKETPAAGKDCASKVEGTLDFSLKAGTSANLVNTAGTETLDSCSTSTVEGKITNSGSTTATVTGTISTPLETTGLTWSGCTFPTKTLKASALEVHHIAGTDNGTVTADGTFEVTINTIFFGSCIYGVTSGTDIGTLVGGNPAHFTANAVAEKFSGSGFACPETSKWTATYVNTTPGGTLHVAAG